MASFDYQRATPFISKQGETAWIGNRYLIGISLDGIYIYLYAGHFQNYLPITKAMRRQLLTT